MGKKDMAIIELTLEQAENYSAKQISDELVPRLSNRRCKTFLVEQVKEGAIRVPATLIGAWTYKAVEVKGVTPPADIPGKTKPIKVISKVDYTKLKPGEVAALIREHATEKRSAYVIQALLVGKKFTPTAHDLVYLSNGRITVAGVTVTATRKSVDIASLVAGVTIGGKKAVEKTA